MGNSQSHMCGAGGSSMAARMCMHVPARLRRRMRLLTYCMPPQRMPAWWEWYSNVNPVAWSVYGLVASQLGDDYTYYVNTCAPPLRRG